MNFSDFTKQSIKNDDQKTSAEEKIKKSYEELKDLDSNSLSKRLFEEVDRQKKNGTFDYETLNKNIDAISPFISSETYKNLKKTIETLK